MSESIESMLARIDERTKNMDVSITNLWEVANDSRDKLSQLEGSNVTTRTAATESDIKTITNRMIRMETKLAPLYAAAAAIFSVVVSFVISLFKSHGV